MELSDKQLLRKFRRGDREAFDALFRRYCARVHATAYRLTASWEDAEDTLQEVFLRLARSAHTIRNGAALKTWIYRTTLNAATDCLRARERGRLRLDKPEQFAKVIAVESVRREAERRRCLERESLLRQVEALIPQLPPRQAQVFVLRGFQGLSHREIGQVLGISESGSKSHHSLACRRVRKLLAQANAAEEMNSEGAAR